MKRLWNNLLERLSSRMTWYDALAFVLCSILAFLPSLLLGASLGVETILLLVCLVGYWFFVRPRIGKD